jgi:hypothetical protein
MFKKLLKDLDKAFKGHQNIFERPLKGLSKAVTRPSKER